MSGTLDRPPAAPRVIPDWAFQTALLVGALLLHLWLLAHTQVTARDSLAFARVALQLDDPNANQSPDEPARSRVDVLRKSEHPPGYPVAVWLASVPVRAVSRAPTAEQFILSTQIASLAAGVLLALVHFRLGRELFGSLTGFLAAALFQILPVVARITSDGLSEGLFLLAVGTALLCGVRAMRSARPSAFFGCGLATAAAYLVRPEGLLVGVVLGALVFAQWIARAASSRATLVRSAALACGVLILAGPYMALVGGVTNKPTGKKLLHWFGEGSATDGSAAVGGSTPLLASWFVPGTDGNKPVWVAASLAKELGKSFHYFPAALAVIGILTIGRRAWRTDPGARVPLTYAGAHLGLLVAMAATSGYLSERHTLPIVFVGCLFAAAAIPVIAGRLAERGRVRARTSIVVMAAIVVFTCLPVSLRPRHDDRVGHVQAGKWLAGHADLADQIVDPFDWAQFYAGRTLYRLPPDVRDPHAVYAVMEEGKSQAPRSKLPKYEWAMAVAHLGQPVYQWPEGGSANGVRVVVYKVVAGH